MPKKSAGNFADTWCYKEYCDVRGKLKSGEITADELRKRFADFSAKFSEIVTLVDESTTKDEVERMCGRRYDKKIQAVEALVGRFLSGFLPEGVSGYSMNYDVLSDRRPWYVKESEAIARVLAKVTDEQLQQDAAKIAAKKEKVRMALIDPQDLDDFQLFVGAKGRDALTDEQYERYDALLAAVQIEAALKKMEQDARVGQIHLDAGVEMLIREDWHDKRGCAIWIVKLSEYVDKIQWKEYDEKARRFGGRFSSWGPAEKHGWIFFHEEDAARFMELTEGDGTVIDRWNRRRSEREQNASLRLQDKAQTVEKTALEELERERKTNTVRRAAQAQSAWESAARDREYAQVLADVSTAIASGETVFLRNIRFATQVELYETLLLWAKYSHIRSENNGSLPKNLSSREPNLSDVRFVKMPWPVLSRSTTAQIVKDTAGKRGAKYARQAIVNLANTQGREQVTFDTWSVVDYMKELFEDGKPPRYEGYYWADIERLRAMGVQSEAFLRAALREFLLYRVVKPVRVDAIRIKELDLVGRRIAGFFPTPASIAQKMVEKIGFADCDHLVVLEPEGGSGRICDAISEVLDETSMLHVCEINPTLRELLQMKGYNLVGDDFLAYDPGFQYDVILMNPPFENQQDIEHVSHAYDLLNEGGTLIAIMSPGWQYGNDLASKGFRELFNQLQEKEVEDLPEGTFKESGTGVASVMVTMQKE